MGFWGAEWCETRLRVVRLHDPESGELQDANDALVAGALTMRKVLAAATRSAPEPLLIAS